MKISDQLKLTVSKIEPAAASQPKQGSNSTGPPLSISPGQLLKAVVTGATTDGNILLEVDGRTITAKSLVQLPVGEELWLEVAKGDSQQPLLTLAAKKGAVQELLKILVAASPSPMSGSKELASLLSLLAATHKPELPPEAKTMLGSLIAATSDSMPTADALKILTSLVSTSVISKTELNSLLSTVTSLLTTESPDVPEKILAPLAKGEVPDPQTLKTLTALLSGSSLSKAEKDALLSSLASQLPSQTPDGQKRILSILTSAAKGEPPDPQAMKTLTSLLSGSSLTKAEKEFLLSPLSSRMPLEPAQAAEKFVATIMDTATSAKPDVKLMAMFGRMLASSPGITAEIDTLLSSLPPQPQESPVTVEKILSSIIAASDGKQHDPPPLKEVARLLHKNPGAASRLQEILEQGLERQTPAKTDVTSVEKLIKIIASHQEVNSQPSAQTSENFFLFPCFFTGQAGWGEWLFSMESERKKGQEQYTLAFFLEMSRLGAVNIHVTIDGKSLNGQFQLENEKVRRHLATQVPQLVSILEKQGYKPVSFTCRALAGNNLLQELKKTLEDKAAINRFSLLDVSV